MIFRNDSSRTFRQAFLFLFIILIIIRFDWLAMFSSNFGWVNLLKGLGAGVEGIQQKNKAHEALINFERAVYDEEWIIDNAFYGYQIAFLSIMENDGAFSSIISA